MNSGSFLVANSHGSSIRHDFLGRTVDSIWLPIGQNFSGLGRNISCWPVATTGLFEAREKIPGTPYLLRVCMHMSITYTFLQHTAGTQHHSFICGDYSTRPDFAYIQWVILYPFSCCSSFSSTTHPVSAQLLSHKQRNLCRAVVYLEENHSAKFCKQLHPPLLWSFSSTLAWRSQLLLSS